MEQNTTQKAPLDPVNIVVEDATRTVTFTSRHALAIHPQVVTVPWAILKATVAELLKYEANMEMALSGGQVQTKTVNLSGQGKA